MPTIKEMQERVRTRTYLLCKLLDARRALREDEFTDRQIVELKSMAADGLIKHAGHNAYAAYRGARRK